MHFTFTPPPSVPLDKIETHLKRAYGLSGILHPIAAERDQNFRLECGEATYLLKICAADEGFALAEAQALALQHIAETGPDLPVPRIINSKSGNAVTPLSHEDEEYPVLLLDWLPGNVMGVQSPHHLPELGNVLARLGKAMRGFAHPAIVERKLIWNVMQADALLPDVKLLPQPWQGRATAILEDFAHLTRPKLRKLRAQTIHGDAHPYNVLIGAQGLSGVIDFGDMIHAPLIVDLANTIADCLHGESDITAVFSQLLSSYHVVTPLEREEVEALTAIVKARLVSTTIIAKLRGATGVGLTESIEELSSTSLAALDNIYQQEKNVATLCLDITGNASRPVLADTMQRRIAAMGPRPLLFYSKPLHMLRGQGVWLHADDGSAYLDCYNNVAHVGHAHPVVADAIARQLRILNTNTRYLTDESIQYAEALKATLDPSLDTVIFVNSGSEANDVAYRMAKVFTGNTGALCMDFAYHGVTTISDALSPSNYPAGKWNFPWVRQLEAPDVYRSSLIEGDAFAALADAPIADLQKHGPGVALTVIDSAFMTNGILVPPQGYVKGIVERTHRAGGLFVADEVQSGFGRLGSHMWGHQRHGVVPDFVTIGKPAGNGYPIGVIVTRAEILGRFVEETGPFFSTFGGGNAACVAGLAVLDVMRREDLMSNAVGTGGLFRDHLKILMQRHELIGDIRGAGLAIGVELVKDRKSREPAREETKRLLDLMRNEGVLIGSDGKRGNVLKIRPPLVFKPEHVEHAVAALDKSLSHV
jgi:4-aminobutyrate aminotransferase-like enzyme/Ser/Thr protein kinase RdoA (MazF antagonist)